MGNFPVLWTEWNGKYRDSVRRFWKGDGGSASELATRLSGSSNLYEQSGRLPYASINFVTCHDGFSLEDLVSHNHKHNEANGESEWGRCRREPGWNCGEEGSSDDPEVLSLRERQKRNLFATLLMSQGVAMIRSGDEIGQTQHGNNNAYCQDNEQSRGWIGGSTVSAQRFWSSFVDWCAFGNKIPCSNAGGSFKVVASVDRGLPISPG